MKITDNFNLLDEEWIPVFYRDGTIKRVGILGALEKAHQIRQIAASNPMDRLAILRFLISLLYWCQGNPPDKLPDDSFSSNWFKKLDDNKDCFNLLGNGKRFYQDSEAKRSQAVTQLIQEIPAGNNFYHFRHSIDKKDGLCPACCAIGLLRLPLFSVSGLSGPGEPNLMAGINGVPPIYCVPWGKSLSETLLANWVKYENIGKPSWVQSGIDENANDYVSLLTGLTLLSRRVFLHDPINESATCVGCGKKTSIIKTCEFKTAGKQENDKWNDPHVIYLNTTSRKAIKAPDLTKAGKFRMDRPWPDLFTRIIEVGKLTSLLVVGFATNKAKNIDVWERTIDVPLSESIPETTISLIHQWQNEGRLKKIGKIIRSRAEGPAVVAFIRPHVESRVSERIVKLMVGGDEEWEQAVDEYRPMMVAIAKSFSPGYTSAAVQKRKKIFSVKPDMRLKSKLTGKSNRKKGGGK